MGNGHRPGHRGRGREGTPSPSDGDRVLVLPGEEIAAAGLKPGPGTYRVHGRTYASVLGFVSKRPPIVRVVALSGRYIPQTQDVVVGTVTDVQGTFWLLDIGAPRWAPLHMTGTPWKIDFGETDQYLHVGDAVVVAGENLDATGRIGVTMNGDGLGKIEGGTIVTVSPARVPRIIGRGGSMITTLTQHTGAKIVVGQNGRIWIDGTDEAIHRVQESLRLIEEEGQRRGLTERITSYLKSTEPPPGERSAPAGGPASGPGRVDWAAREEEGAPPEGAEEPPADD
ncbi:MAG TPA: exosome complex RNA-binding protein Rrp4 [Thermoplasmata archaeon]|nr:exosome complex RNA-binding protein Rrp4 [Thermoplasmata archaeon]